MQEDNGLTPEPKIYTMIRKGDQSGVSGVGRVADIFLCHNGKVILVWRTDVDAAKHGNSSIGIYESWESFYYVHCLKHPANRTEIVEGKISWSKSTT
jgi:hypothetical protein